MNILTVTDNDARVRAGPPGFKWDGRSRIPRFTRVQITQENGKHVQVNGLQGRKLGWTTRSNLTRFFKDSFALQHAQMLPAQAVPGSAGIGRTYNRLGGLMGALAKETKIKVSNYKKIGYRTPVAMYNAFQANERNHVLGFFDFCQKRTSTSSLLEFLRKQNWTSFAAGYNGSGQAEKYGGLIKDNFEKAQQLLS